MKGTPSLVIMFSSEYGDLSVVVYVDSNCVGGMDDINSIIGYLL